MATAQAPRSAVARDAPAAGRPAAARRGARAADDERLAQGLLPRSRMMEAKSYVADAVATSKGPLPAGASPVARCACGHELGHREVLPEPTYTTWAWFVFLLGATARPRQVLYRCLRCRQVVAMTRAPSVLARFD